MDAPMIWIHPLHSEDRRHALAVNTLMWHPFDPLTGDNLRWLLAAFWLMVESKGYDWTVYVAP